MKRQILSIFFGILYTLSTYGVSFYKLDLTDGLTNPAIISICQDELGRMWLGSREGINIFDGKEIICIKGNVTAPNGTKLKLGGYVSMIKSDHSGNMFVLSDFNLFRFNLRENQYEQLSKGNNTPVFTVEKGSVWYIQKDTLKKYHISSETHEKIKAIRTPPILCLKKLDTILFVGTKKGLHIISKDSTYQPKELKNIAINCILKSFNNEIWIGTADHGIYKYINNQLIKVSGLNKIRDINIRNFTEDKEGNIWIATKDGLYKYDRKDTSFSLIKTSHYLGGLKHNAVYSLFNDKQGNIWLGTFNEGVSYFNPKDSDFVNYTYQNATDLSGKFKYIKDMVFDKNEHLWIATIADGVSCLDSNWNVIKRLNTQSKNQLPSNHIEDLVYDVKRNQLYIGMYRQGGLSIYDLGTDKLTHYPLSETKYRQDKNTVFHLELWNDKLYMSSPNAIYQFDPANGSYSQIRKVQNYCWDFKINEEGTVFARDERDLMIFSLNNPTEAKIIKIGTKISSLILNEKGVYIFTLGNGIFHYNAEDEKITHFNRENSSIPADYCYQGTRITKNNYAITCSEGIILFNQHLGTFSLITKYRRMNPVMQESGILASDKNNLFIGGAKGIIKINSTKINNTEIGRDEAANRAVIFSDLRINNELIKPNLNQSILTNILPFTSSIHLESHENNITLSLSNIDFTRQDNETEFLYKLEGIDKEWNKTTNHSIRLVNMRPGKYTLKAKLDMQENEKVSSLDIIIDYPIYARWWAICIYICIISIILLMIYRYQNHQRLLKISLINEKFEKRQMERLNQEKLTFFTNISHEFRTPLTLIISHLDPLLEDRNIPTSIYSSIYKIKKNAQYMNNLISELLDFRKFSQNSFGLDISKNDYVAFLKEFYLSYSDMAYQNNISFNFITEDKVLLGYFDIKQMEKVFFNLLSNAFKYTPKDGSISIQIDKEGDFINVKVTDTGVGIDKEDIKKVFNRFYQGMASKGQEHAPGTGIGLALTKTIVDYHHGDIFVESEKGKKTTFYVRLPLKKEAFENDSNIKFVKGNKIKDSSHNINITENYITDNEIPVSDYLEFEEESENNRKTLLIVEDNPELLTVLNNIFKEQFDVILACNGKEGLEKTFAFKPDLIISDIMMPEMNGTDMCLKIKNNIDLCHIPIILLTALNTEQQNIEGLNRGADDYICKPFNTKILIARVNNLLRNRILIQAQINKQPISEIDLTSISSLDQKLLKKTEDVLLKNLDNTDFGVSDLCNELAMGRSLLFSKFKALTGITPYKYILNFRLNNAASMLHHHPDMLLTEISDKCGFSSSAYFSRCFKNYFGVSPQNYKKRDE